MGFIKRKEALADLLAPIGRHSAVITDFSVSEGDVETWANCEFKLTESGHVLTTLSCIDAAVGSRNAGRVNEGIDFLVAVGTAVGVDVHDVESPNDLIGTLVGLAVDVTVVHRKRKGNMVAEVKAVMPPKPDEAPPKARQKESAEG
jgi:hypothetical protein